MEFDAAVAELEALVETLEREDDKRALLLLDLIDAIHRPGIEQLAGGEPGGDFARALLVMYGVTEPDDELLVEEALDGVRPYIESHGGHVELVAVDDGIVRLQMGGACDGCAASTMTLRRGIETALREGYPGFREVVAEEPADISSGGQPLLQIEGLDVKQPVFVDAAPAGGLAEGEINIVEADGAAVLVLAVEGEEYAFRDGCAVDGQSLAGGRLSGLVLVCPWHNCTYDARSGKRLDDGSDAGLTVLPVAIRDGRVKVAVNVA